MGSKPEDILSSRAKWRICYALSEHSSAIHLRYIATLTDLHPHAVEQALKSLLAQKVVTKKKRRQKTLYELNAHHPDAQFLVDLFTLYQKHALRRQAEIEQKKALKALQFAASSKQFFDKALPNG